MDYMRYGLCHVVDIYKLKHKVQPRQGERRNSDRLSQSKLIENNPKYTNVACRIIDEKTMIITRPLELCEGDVIYNKQVDLQYKVKSSTKVYGIGRFHHLRVELEDRMVGDIFDR